ncbi:hypothetical protein ACI68E_003975 [Malassezia pachydermatis]
MHPSEAIHPDSDAASAQDDEDAGSLEDFVVDDDEEIEEEDSASEPDSSDSGIVAVSPPPQTASRPSKRLRSKSPISLSPSPPAPTSSDRRRERLEALREARLKKLSTSNVPEYDSDLSESSVDDPFSRMERDHFVYPDEEDSSSSDFYH